MYLRPRFFFAFILLILLFLCSFQYVWLLSIAQTALLILVALVVTDAILLFLIRKPLEAKRILPSKLSLGDTQTVTIDLLNNTKLGLYVKVIDELPSQFQDRSFDISFSLSNQERKEINYSIRPTERGIHVFHHLNVFFATKFLGFLERKIKFEAKNTEVAVYPSLIQMKEWELKVINKYQIVQGERKLRKIGASYEFEQIKEYVRGDDYRHINWKSSARNNKLMLNMYEEEKSQAIYSIIDKGRSMKLPFNQLSLLDYSVNTTLALSNIILKKGDKAGVISFSNGVGTCIKADNKPGQINAILQSLYQEKEYDNESNYELLYQISKRIIRNRSMILLYTNFESIYSAKRILPLLRKINKEHLLLVIFFENSELIENMQEPAIDVQDIYYKTAAHKLVAEKSQIVYTLQQHGITTILTKAEDLTAKTIAKYLEMKSVGAI